MRTIIQQINYQDCQAIVSINYGKSNSITPQMIFELSNALEDMRTDPNVTVLILESMNEKFFSIGFDIPSLIELATKDFHTFYSSFNRLCLTLYTFPKPTIAVIQGHAIAGGCILALCCDRRFMMDGHNLIGLNEIKLGVPVPYPADCILRDLVGSRQAREIVESGSFYQPPDALSHGLVDKVIPEEDICQEVSTQAQILGSMPSSAFWAIKKNRIELVESQILAKLEEKEQQFVDLWFSDEARHKLIEAVEKF
jgi:enoyl-CoA hydratase/carnithine racemase